MSRKRAKESRSCAESGAKVSRKWSKSGAKESRKRAKESRKRAESGAKSRNHPLLRRSWPGLRPVGSRNLLRPQPQTSTWPPPAKISPSKYLRVKISPSKYLRLKTRSTASAGPTTTQRNTVSSPADQHRDTLAQITAAPAPASLDGRPFPSESGRPVSELDPPPGLLRPGLLLPGCEDRSVR